MKSSFDSLYSLSGYKGYIPEHPFASVIIPVYNTKQYLNRCLDSVCLQSEPNIEIIVIDDASPDGSWQLIEEYSQSDSRIVPIRHEVNKHLGGARNTGIDAAKGDWIIFLDSDDYIAHNTVQTILDYSKKYPNVELLHNILIFTDSEGQIIFERIDQNIQNAMIIPNLFHHYCSVQHPVIWHVACGNIWKRNFLVANKLRFPEKTSIEDFAVFMQWIYKLSGSILVIPERLYYYRQHSKSITNNINKQVSGIIKAINILDSWSDTLDEKSRNLVFNRVCHEIKDWVYYTLDQKHGDILLQNIPKRYAVKLFRQAITNRWYYFGQLSRKSKLWTIAKFLGKRLFVYKILRPFAVIVKNIFEQGRYK